MKTRDYRTKFKAFEFDLWDSPRGIKDVLHATFVDNPFGLWFNLCLFNFSIGFTFFGMGLTLGFNSPLYGYLTIDGLGFKFDICSGWTRDYTPVDAFATGVEAVIKGMDNATLDLGEKCAATVSTVVGEPVIKTAYQPISGCRCKGP